MYSLNFGNKTGGFLQKAARFIFVLPAFGIAKMIPEHWFENRTFKK